jgi:type II secretory pathway component PulF
MRYKITYQKDNKLTNITLEAANKDELKALKNFPDNIVSIKKTTIAYNKNISLIATNNKKKVYELFSQLDIMLGANLSFHESIDLLLKSKNEDTLHQILEEIKKALTYSIPLDKALKNYESYLGVTVLLFLKLGFENGNIKEAMHSLVEILYEDIKSQEKFKEAMRYPFILIISLCISVGMIFIYVLPNFDFLFALLKDDIPLSTQILLGIKNIFMNYGVIIVITLVLLFIISVIVIQKNKFSYDRFLLLKIPFLSKVIQNYYFYRLFLSISIIVRSKYQFQLAVLNSKNIVQNLYIQERMNFILSTIKNGSSVAEAFDKSTLFDTLTIKLLHTADYTNEYEQILSDITNLYKKKFQKSLKNFSSTIEPVLIFIISLIVLWLILAIMLPIWNLGSVIN